MWVKMKKWACYLSIIVLLPYVLTVFLNGPGIVSPTTVDDREVRVSVDTASEKSSGQNQEENGEDGKPEGETDPVEKSVSMPLEDYCVGIMAKEIPADYQMEALKAQAVLVRTEIFREIGEKGSGAVMDTEFWTQEEMEKAWGVTKYNRYRHRLENAWQATEGKVLMKDGIAANAPFCRLTNGSTRNGAEVLGEEYAYLKPVDCEEDIEAQEQIQTVTLEDMDAEVTDCDSCGYVLAVRVGKEKMSGEAFRDKHQLASSCFTLQKFNGKLRITTRGVGHGLGMSQFTANKLAKSGEGYEKILSYFFEELNLQEVADIVE